MTFQPVSIDSQAVHAAESRRYQGRPDLAQRSDAAMPVVGPIHPSVSYVYPATADLDAALGGDPARLVYHRYGNPTVRAFEDAMAVLESRDLPAGEVGPAVRAVATASGMAAIQLALMAAGARAGVTIAAAADCYGATYTLIDKVWGTLGARGLLLDVHDLAHMQRVLSAERPLLLLVEILSNPLLKVADVAALAELCHRYGTLLLVDNTFATPYLYRPLAAGADFVIHSGTKFIGGHGDVMGGVVVAAAHWYPALWEQRKITGATLGPFEAWLLARGLKTLPLRMARQCANAQRVAEWLQRHPAIARVHYPGSTLHPHHPLAARVFGGMGYGALISFDLVEGSQERAFALLERLQMIQPATSLGDVYTLIMYPAHSSHRGLTPQQRQAQGIGPGLLRLSVGIEGVEDILADLEQALASSG